MKLSREQFVGQFGISFGVHCLRRIEITPTQELWVPKKAAAPAEKATLI